LNLAALRGGLFELKSLSGHANNDRFFDLYRVVGNRLFKATAVIEERSDRR